MEVNIVLGWNRHTIPSCRMKMPIPQHCDDAIIHAMSKSLKKPFFHHGALCVNRDFHNYVTLNAAGQL
jgi:hypothetical protein